MSLDEWKLIFSKDGIEIFKKLESPIDKQFKEIAIDKMEYDGLIKKFDNKLNLLVTKIEPKIENNVLRSLTFYASEFRFIESQKIQEMIPISAYEKILVIGKERIPWNKYNDILKISTRWLFKNVSIQKKDLPIYVPNGGRYLINSKPYHEYNREFDSYEKISEDIYLNTNFSGPDCKRHAQYLMKKFAPDIDFKILGFPNE